MFVWSLFRVVESVLCNRDHTHSTLYMWLIIAYSFSFLFWRMLQVLVLDHLLWQRGFNLSLPIIHSFLHHTLSRSHALRRFCSSRHSWYLFLNLCIELWLSFIFFRDLFILLATDFFNRNFLGLCIGLSFCLIPNSCHFILNYHCVVQARPADRVVCR